MAYTDQVTVATDAGFQSRVEMALVTAARGVLQQAPDATTVGPKWQRRLALAIEIARNPSGLVVPMSWLLASIPGATTTVTDSVLQNYANTLLANIADNETGL